ncbi:MAG: Sulfate/thiosulfate import ATP-binding protein CysA [Firmicutes bacterium]|nr:Sulfate/thiosulfate import ATP-binding protein CysA [Bacillota bacterium]
MHVVAKDLKKSFGFVEAVKGISFELEKGKLIALLSPSGGGKTTVLRMLAGLEHPDSGEIFFHGQEMTGVPPRDRNVGLVFQHYALFRHMTVFDNVAFGLTVKKATRAEIKQRVSELLDLTGLAGLERRYPHQLSGGQRQRVALARALAPNPQLLLLDEPFAAIDSKIRKELRTWLKKMIGQVGITSVFVTHDQEEAVELADEIIIINQGRQGFTGPVIKVRPATSCGTALLTRVPVMPWGCGPGRK